MWLATRTGLALAAFALAAAIAGLFGAENLGTAFAFGQIAFTAAVAALIIRT